MTAVVADIPTVIRPCEAGDLSFVWETSLKVRKPHTTSWAEWLEAKGRELSTALHGPGSVVRVMESGDVLVGFAHFVGGVLRMLYVKRDLRGFGFGLQLLGGEGRTLVHVWRPNACWRRWAYTKNLKWKEAT